MDGVCLLPILACRWVIQTADVFGMETYKSILHEWGISERYLSDVVNDNPSVKGMIVGYIAERKLRDLLGEDPRVIGLRKDDDHDRTKKGDVTFTYRDHEFKVESKALQTTKMYIHDAETGEWVKNVYQRQGKKNVGNPHYHTVRGRDIANSQYRGEVQCDASDRRVVALPNGMRVNTTSLVVGEFDLLAAGLFAFRNSWDFAFCLNRDLPRTQSDKYPEEAHQYLLKTLVPVSWPIAPPFVSDPFTLLDKLVSERSKKRKF